MPQDSSLSRIFSAAREEFAQLILERLPAARRAEIAAQLARDLDATERGRLVEKLVLEMPHDEQEKLLLAIAERLPAPVRALLLAHLAAEGKKGVQGILKAVLGFILLAWAAKAAEIPIEELWAALKGRLAAQAEDVPHVTPPPAPVPTPYPKPPRPRPFPERHRRTPGPTVIEPELVSVPEGEFWMGTSDAQIAWLVKHTDWAKRWRDEGWFKPEQPQRRVYLSAYRIARYPVTNREYQAFVQDEGYKPPSHWEGDVAPDEIADHPVTHVAHGDALAYCAWLAERTGKPYTLPTEAQWEKAARGDRDARLYPWGDVFDARRCNTAESGPGGTTPVGQYSPDGDSPYGCADMAGNVWEWCLDWYAEDYYRRAPNRNPPGPSRGDFHVVRGGSWIYDQRYARCACRCRGIPGSWGIDIGYRPVLSLARSES